MIHVLNIITAVMLVFLGACSGGKSFSGGISQGTSEKKPKPAVASSSASSLPASPSSLPPSFPVPPSPGPAPSSQPESQETLSVVVLDATNKNPIAGATAEAASGETCTTDSEGSCSIKVAPGVEVVASANGYIPQTLVAANATLNFVLSPVLSTGETRIVLTWGDDPADLDSHLRGPNGLHLWYVDMEEKGAVLDVDSTDGFGPETSTLSGLAPGRYEFSVVDFSNLSSEGNSTSDALAKSGAVVRIFIEGQPTQTVNVPQSGRGLVWKVFSFDVAANGAITINLDGTFTDGRAEGQEDVGEFEEEEFEDE